MESRTLTITSATCKYGNLNLRKCGREFFPKDVFGSSSRDTGIGTPITLSVEGLDKAVKTDIPTDRTTGKPRWIFRERSPIKRFVSSNNLIAGDSVTITRLDDRAYCIHHSNSYVQVKKRHRITKSLCRNRPKKMKTLFPQLESVQLDARKINIRNSPKNGGSSKVDSIPYLKELNVAIVERRQSIQFTPNINEHIHRWAPYVQGFSALFVQGVLEQYKSAYRKPVILDPFAGCGTVLVQAKLNGYKSVGVELNPLLQFIADAKLNSWDVCPRHLLDTYRSLPKNKVRRAPSFLRSTSQFKPRVLSNLEIINGAIHGIQARTPKQKKSRTCCASLSPRF